MTYKTKAGGFRELLDLNHNPPTVYSTQYFTGDYKTLSVEFKFDFHPPSHCGETSSCRQEETMLTVPDFVKVRRLLYILYRLTQNETQRSCAD